MNKIGLHIIGGWSGEITGSTGAARPRIIKLVDPSTEVAHVRHLRVQKRGRSRLALVRHGLGLSGHGALPCLG